MAQLLVDGVSIAATLPVTVLSSSRGRIYGRAKRVMAAAGHGQPVSSGRRAAELPAAHLTATITPHRTMAPTLVAALALAALPSALAFRNTSPFFLFSTAE